MRQIGLRAEASTRPLPQVPIDPLVVLWTWLLALADTEHILIVFLIFRVTGCGVGACKAGQIIHALAEFIGEQIGL